MRSSRIQRVDEDEPSGQIIIADILRFRRQVEPAHCILKIESFTTLSESVIGIFESNDFEAGSNKWRICLHPNGNKKKNVNDHISMYLAVSDTGSFPKGWEVNVYFKFFVYDHSRDDYLTIEDGRIRRFHWMKTEWGFDELLSLKLLKDASSGYLFDDSCVFGAEVFVVKSGGDVARQCLQMRNETETVSYTWKIDHFFVGEKFLMAMLKSDEINDGDLKWEVCLRPNGYLLNKKAMIYVSLNVANGEMLPPNWKAYVEYKVRIMDQIKHNHEEVEDCGWFSDSNDDCCWAIMLLSDLKAKGNGFMVNDTLTVEVEIKTLALAMNLI